MIICGSGRFDSKIQNDFLQRRLQCGDPLFRIQFFNRDEVESDMMEEEVMYWNVQLMLLELID